MILPVFLGWALGVLAVASVFDLKTREVPDWLSYGCMFLGIGVRMLASVMYADWMFLVEGMLGLVVMLGMGMFMFYTGQWGGGDSKLLIGIGALLGLSPRLDQMPALGLFLLNTLFAGAFYGLIYSGVLAVRHRGRFSTEFGRVYYLHRRWWVVAMAIGASLCVAAIATSDFITKAGLLVMAFLVATGYYLYVYVRALEGAVMIKKIPVERLTEGDWIVDDVLANKRLVAKKGKISAHTLQQITSVTSPKRFGKARVRRRFLFIDVAVPFNPASAREGDVLLDDLYAGTYVCGPADLGIEKRQITELLKMKAKGVISQITVKEGIPFVPGFFLGLVMTIVLGNWLQLIVTV